jgi:lipopolysaccharide export LptBFGC system permease protein LptF
VNQAILALAVFGSLVAFVNAAWVVPIANQAFRAVVLGWSGVNKGANELTLRELTARISTLTLPSNARELRLLWLSFHGRMALSLAPLVFGCLALAAMRTTRRRPVTTVTALAGFVLYVAYYTVPDFPQMVEAGRVPPTLVAWVPNAVVVLLTLIFLMNTRRDAPGTQHGT